MADDYVSLVNLGGGAAVALFDQEMQKVLDDIWDPNTSESAVRAVVLTVKIKPDADGALGAVEITATSKLPGVKGFKSVFHMDRDPYTGHVVAMERNPAQFKLFDPPEPDPKKVVDFDKERSAGE